MRQVLRTLLAAWLAALPAAAAWAVPALVNPALGTLQVLATDTVGLAGVNALALDGHGNLYATRQQGSLSDGVSWVNTQSGTVAVLNSGIPGADHMVFDAAGNMLLTAEAPATVTLFGFTVAVPNLYRLSVSYDGQQHPGALGSTSLAASPTLLNFPEGLVYLPSANAYGAAGDLLIAEDRASGRILRVTPSAGSAAVAVLVPAAAGLPRPEGLAFGDFGGALAPALYGAVTTSGRIVRLGADGSVTPVGSAGVLNAPDNLAFGPDGRLYIGEDPQNGNPARLFAMSADGTLDLIADGFTTLQGLAFDPASGDLYIAEQSTSTIWRLQFGPGADLPLPGSASLVALALGGLALRRRLV